MASNHHDFEGCMSKNNFGVYPRVTEFKPRKTRSCSLVGSQWECMKSDQICEDKQIYARQVISDPFTESATGTSSTPRVDSESLSILGVEDVPVALSVNGSEGACLASISLSSQIWPDSVHSHWLLTNEHGRVFRGCDSKRVSQTGSTMPAGESLLCAITVR